MVLFFVPELRASTDGVFRSQVLAQAEMLQRFGKKVFIISTDKKGSLDSAYKLLDEMALEGVILPYYPSKGNILTINLAVILATFWLLFRLRTFNTTTHYYTRYVFTGIITLLMIRKSFAAKWVHDFRGLTSEEATINRRMSPAMYAGYRTIKLFEIACAQKADRLICVSARMAEYLKFLCKRTDITIIPCGVNIENFDLLNSSREKYRNQWNVGEDEWIFTYSGSLLRWQKSEDTLSLLTQLLNDYQKAHVLIITPQSNPLLNNLERSVHFSSRLHIYYGKNLGETIDLLSAADVGIILRDNILLNQVSSPIKISEYLASGLAVAASPHIGDASQLIEQEQLGCVLPGELSEATKTLIEFCESDINRSVLRSQCFSAARRFYSWQSSLPKLKEIYQF